MSGIIWAGTLQHKKEPTALHSHMLQWNPGFPSLLHTLSINLSSQKFEEWMPWDFFVYYSSPLLTLHFTANAVSRPQEEISCLFQCNRKDCFITYLTVQQQPPRIHTQLSTPNWNKYLIPPSSYISLSSHCTQHVLFLANCH